LLAGEVVGIREITGATLVLLAGFTELVRLTSPQEPIV
jgi:hypothetical protein